MSATIRCRLLLAAAAVLLATPAGAAATLRPFTTLNAPVVRLRDLFADAGSDAARVLGPAPAPGSRISVPAHQLAVIAREYGVDWKPVSGFESAVLIRPGAPLALAPVLAALRAALAGVGAPPGSAVVLDGFAAPMLPLAAKPQIAVEQLAYDANEGGFQGVLAVSVPGEPTLSVPVAGRSVRRVRLAVAAHRLEPGTALGPADFVERDVALPAARAAELRRPSDAFGQGVRHAVAAGAPVPLDDLMVLPAIRRGQRVTMEIEAPGLAVVATGVALADAGMGERVDVLNPVSHAVVRAAVLGPGRVAVEPGSLPLRADAMTGLVR
ncbi:MAG: flagellar basal body P-ring formation protein FlgA [Rhodospirillales bacterium]|nr:flagellar basal body P-ring formation protein FlgA [Rhodospirillales bacterium]